MAVESTYHSSDDKSRPLRIQLKTYSKTEYDARCDNTQLWIRVNPVTKTMVRVGISPYDQRGHPWEMLGGRQRKFRQIRWILRVIRCWSNCLFSSSHTRYERRRRWHLQVACSARCGASSKCFQKIWHNLDSAWKYLSVIWLEWCF